MAPLNRIIDTGTPPIRHLLKAKIFECSYSRFVEFAREVNISHTYLSSILNGHLFPSNTVQGRMAKALGMTLQDLRRML